LSQEISIYAPSLEDFDFVIYEWINNDVNVFCNQIDGWKKVPVVFATPERAVLSKASIDTRDEKGTLKYPIISITNTDIQKPDQHDGNMAVNLFAQKDPYSGAITIAKRISQNSTAKFANNNSFQKTGKANSKIKNKEIVYEFITIPQPTFIEKTYEIIIISNFQQQINEIMSPFITKYGNINYFIKRRNDWTYECFFEQSLSPDNNINDFSDEERLFKSKFSIKVKGYILESKNNEQPIVSIRESVAKIVLKKEFVFKGTIDEYLKNK